MNLHIPNPCHENWDAMHPLEKGRFCDVCKKQVFDFTNATLNEVKQQYDKNNGDLCGRISAKLLQEQFVQAHYKSDYFKTLKQFLFAAIVCFGFSLFTINKTEARALKSMKQLFFAQQSDTAQIIIKGKITDKESKEELPFVNVVFMDGDSVITTVNSNIDGNYSLALKQKNYKKPKLKFIYIGYEPIILENIKMSSSVLNVDMKMQVAVLGGAIIGMQGTLTPAIKNPFNSGKVITAEEYQRMPK